MSTRRWPLVVFALAFAYALKRYYSQADAESVRWILAPTAWGVGAVFGQPFSFAPGYGYVSRELSFAIVPACAGLNFLVIVVGAYACGIVPQVTGVASRLRWLACGMLAAFGVTVLANTVRITIAVWLQLHPIDVDRAQLHRIEGTLVYLLFLFAFYAVSQSRVRKHAL